MPLINDELKQMQEEMDDSFDAYWAKLKWTFNSLSRMAKEAKQIPELLQSPDFRDSYAHLYGELIGLVVFAPVVGMMMVWVQLMRLLGPGKFVVVLGTLIGATLWMLCGGSSPWTFMGAVSASSGAIVLAAKAYIWRVS